MAAQIPSLNGLRVFEAAARHLSFTRAAVELFVSQAAVSQQIRALETELGQALFRREGRALALTEAGLELAAATRTALEHLHDGLARVRARGKSKTLSVSMMPSFAAKWLVPRLGRFLAAHPEVDLKIHTSLQVVDLRRGEADMAIRHGSGNYPGLAVSLVGREEIFPVCSPELMNGRSPLRVPADLAGHTLFLDFGESWRPWLEAANVQERAIVYGTEFLDTNLALQAAIDGQGIALGRTIVAADDLAAGRLVRPFDLAVPAPHAYWIVQPSDQETRPEARAFRDWISAEIRATPGVSPALLSLPA
ncbi:MAG: transcriptional regulator GcvA [Pseudomonadota bacterium]